MTTTSRSATNTSIGTRPGANGAVATRSSSASVSSEIAANPVRLLPPSLRSHVICRTEPVYIGGEFDRERQSFEIDAAISETDRIDAINALKRTLAPADKKLVLAQIASLYVSTTQRTKNEGDLTLLTAIYADYMGQYPTDAVIGACRDWLAQAPEQGKWWPLWAELRPFLDRRVERRRALLATLEGYTPPPAQSQLRPGADPPPTSFDIAATVAAAKRTFAAAEQRRVEAHAGDNAHRPDPFKRTGVLPSDETMARLNGLLDQKRALALGEIR